MDFYSLYLAIATILSALTLCRIWVKQKPKNKNAARRKEAPEPPGSWPIIGHLHLLMGTTPVHRLLAAYADQYGSALMFRFGIGRTLVVSSWELAKECFTTHDRTFATRPSTLASKLMGYDHAMFGFAPYGPYWRDMRKIASLELLSHRRIEQLKHVRVLEVGTCIKEMFGLWAENEQNPVRVEMKQLLEDLTFNIVMQTVAGKRYFGRSVPEADEGVARRYRNLVKEVNHFFVVSGLFDALPFLKWVDFLGNVRAMKRVGKEVDSIIQGWIDEHRRETESEAGHDFIDVLLSSVREGEPQTAHNTDIVIKATVLSILGAAVDTTSSTMAWTLAMLLKNTTILQKLQAELDLHVGRDRMLHESDVTNLQYLQCVVKETLRLYPAGSLLLPHEAMEDCRVGGFEVKRGTRLLVNAWKIHREPGLWLAPEEFRPERFLGEDDTVSAEKLIAFGMGRRSCPGKMFALQTMHLALARLLHAFEFVLPADAKFDCEEGFAVTLFKLNPLQVLVTPRLPLELYQ